MEIPKHLDQAIGQRLREFRELNGRRQDEIAGAAREWGLPWTRATIAAIELGRRKIAIEEFLLLPTVLRSLNFAGPVPGRKNAAPIELWDLLPENGSVSLSRETRVTSSALQLMMRGKSHEITEGVDAPALRDDGGKLARALAAQGDRAVQKLKLAHQIWPQAKSRDVIAAERAAHGEAERNVAKKLGGQPFEVAIAALAQWGCSLSEERDRRVSARANTIIPRSVQAFRGHITRELAAQVEVLLQRQGAVSSRRPKSERKARGERKRAGTKLRSPASGTLPKPVE
jgi:hypothetical protein